MDRRRCWGQTENGHPAHAEGGEPRPGGAQPRRGPDAPGVARDSASFVLGRTSPGAGRQPHWVAKGGVAKEAECVRLLPGLLPRGPTAVHPREWDGSTMETTTPP